MNVLLDTCALLALARGALPARAAAALRAAPDAHVSAVSPWEVAIVVHDSPMSVTPCTMTITGFPPAGTAR